jgi:UDP-N-acetylglucosamine 2-epimerase (non-hydrolysing)
LVGTNAEDIVATAMELFDNSSAYERMARAGNPFGDGRAADRIAEILRLN